MKKYSILISIFCLITTMLYSQPPKLPNCGNTCYLNAATQALYAISPLTEFLKNDQKLFPENTYGDRYQTLVRTVKPLTITPQKALDAYVKKGVKIIKKLTKENPFAQEDASEFLGAILNRLIHETTNAEFNNFLSNLIGIFEEQIIDCPLGDGEYFTASTQSITDFYLKLPTIDHDKKLHTLEACLEAYIKPEILNDPFNYYHYTPEDRYIANCKKQMQLLHTSPFLLISLKRYTFNAITHAGEKISHPITIPFTLDMRPYLVAPENNTRYKLVAIIMHSGTASGGHYVAYTKHHDQWYLCDDNVITPVEKSKVQKEIQTGYVYIYQQAETRVKEYSLAQLLNRLKNKLTKLQQLMR